MASLTPRPLYSRGRTNSIHCTGGRVEPRAGLDVSEKITLMCIALASGTVCVYVHRCSLSRMPTRIPYLVCPPVYHIVYAHLCPLLSMPAGIEYRLCPHAYLIAYAQRYTLLCRPTGINYKLCQPVYLIAYAHLYTLLCMPSDIPYRVCTPV